MQVSTGTKPGFSEVRFDVKPAESVREALKAAGYRWSGHNACWYGRTDRLPADLPAATPAPCPVRDRLAAEPSAELAAIRAELAALRAHIAGLRAATTAAVTVDTSGDVTAAAVPVAAVPKSAPVAAVPPVVAPVRPVPVRTSSPVRAGSIGRTIAVDAGKWA